MEGYIKLYRKLLISPVFENEKLLKIFIWCLLKASHKEREQVVGRQVVKLEKGQFIYGRKKASKELKIKETTLYDYLKLLENLSIIRVIPNNKYSIVCIEKWELYQIQEEKTDIKYDNKPTTNRQQMDTNKNVKNIYINLLNKYKGQNLKTFFGKMKFYNTIKEDELVKKLSSDDEYELKNMILGES